MRRVDIVTLVREDRAHGRTLDRRYCARWAPDVIAVEAEPGPQAVAGAERLGVILTEYTLATAWSLRRWGRDLADIWRDLERQFDCRVWACVAALAFLWASRGGR